MALVDEVRLRAIQQPSRVERLLVAFALRAGIIAPNAYMIRDRNSMLPELQDLIRQAESTGQAWCGWSDNTQIALLTGDTPLDVSRKLGSPALDVKLYGENGVLKERGLWVVDREGGWCRRSETRIL